MCELPPGYIFGGIPALGGPLALWKAGLEPDMGPLVPLAVEDGAPGKGEVRLTGYPGVPEDGLAGPGGPLD